MKMIFSLLLAIAATIGSHTVSASTPYVDSTSAWTLADQEPADHFEGSGSGSGPALDLDSDSEYQWIKRFNNGSLRVATSADIEKLTEWIAGNNVVYNHKGLVMLSSQAPTQLEDGPTKVVEESERSPITVPPEASERDNVLGQNLEEVDSSNYYPEYGIGVLDNGCTAFLVGPRHALTTATCVYDYGTGSWKGRLNFWRGRNGDEYLTKMYWDHVIIPAKFFVTGHHVHNWAMIVFTENSTSPVWLKMAYSHDINDKVMTVYGYLPDDRPWSTMYTSVCSSDPMQDSGEILSIQCGTDKKFSGGPILKGYNIQRGRMPHAYGISTAYRYSYAHDTVMFHPNLFWSLCYLMREEGFDAKCTAEMSLI